MASFHSHARVRLARWLLLFIVLAAVIVAVVWWRDNRHPVQLTKPTSTAISSTATNSQPATFDKQQYSVNDPASLWVVVNKGRVLPGSYVPANLAVPKVALSESSASENMHLRTDTSAAVEKLVLAAASDGLKLMLVSGYRSYGTQQSVYNGYVSSQGQAYADSTSARPGHSEHQTGLAADLGTVTGKCQLDICFGDTPEGKWLAVNAYKYGFIIRYQKDKQSLTGYAYEPWHIRYVGSDLATQINKSGQTLEQFFTQPSFSDYPSSSYQLH